VAVFEPTEDDFSKAGTGDLTVRIYLDASATRFVMDLHEGEQDYTKLRGELFAGKTLDELSVERQAVPRPHRRQR